MADLRSVDWTHVWEMCTSLPAWTLDAEVARRSETSAPRLALVHLPTPEAEGATVTALCSDNYSHYAAWRDDGAAYQAEQTEGLLPAAFPPPKKRNGAIPVARMCFAAASEVVRQLGTAAGMSLSSEWIAQAVFACAAVESRYAPVGYRVVAALAGAPPVRDLGMLQITPKRLEAAKKRKLTGPLLSGVTHASLGIPFVAIYVGAVEWAAWFAGVAGRKTVEGLGAFWAGWAGMEFPPDLLKDASFGRVCPALRGRDFDRLPRLRKTVAILFPDSHLIQRPTVPVPSIWRWVDPSSAVSVATIPFIALAYRELADRAKES